MPRRAVAFAFFILVPAAFAAEPTLTAKRRDALVDVVEKCKAAAVNIHSERNVPSPLEDPFRTGGGPLAMQRVNGMGTGIVVDHRGYVVTNFHVVDDIQVLKVRLVDGRQVPARVLALDKKADLALIKIDVPQPLPVATLGTASDLLDAEQVIAIGNAYGYEHTVSIGNVAYKSRDVSLNKEISYQGLIQTTAPINPGNSGGPLFNKKGELIGVNVAIRAGAQNIAFAIPVDTMIDRTAEMLSVKKRNGAHHGLTLKDNVARPDEEAAANRWVSVQAASFGEVRPGDIIEKVGSVEVKTSIDVERGFLDRVGQDVPVEIRRGAERLTVLHRPVAVTNPASGDLVQRRLGLSLAVTSRDVVAKADPQLRGGLLVIDVAGPAALAGLQRGDVIVGFHQWEAISLDNVHYVLNHKELASFSPIKTFFIRENKVRETAITPAE